MRKITLSIGLLTLSLLMAACGDEPDRDREEMRSSPTATEAVAVVPTINYPEQVLNMGNIGYNTFCKACHGPDARGLEGYGVNLIESEFIRTHTDEELLAMVIEGRPLEHPDNHSGILMPPRAGFPNLQDARILEIIAYLRSLQAGE